MSVTSGTTEPTFGFRWDTILPGTDYRFTSARGLFDSQLTGSHGRPNRYGIDPIHLGIIFLANLELGLLTPTAGINIFLSSYRFGKPVLQVSRAVIPMQCILFVGLLLITYLPALTTFLPRWLGR